jgi:hypothetical protein
MYLPVGQFQNKILFQNEFLFLFLFKYFSLPSLLSEQSEKIKILF